MTAHRPNRPPSPGPAQSGTSRVPIVRAPPSSVSDDDDDDDDALSLSSSDLEHSWLTVPNSEGGTSVSGSASALGSAAVSDLDPSSDSDHDWASDFENPTIEGIPNVSGRHYDADTDHSDVEDTPSPLDSFQRSFVFPDPNSASASFSTIKDNESTPVPSIVDIASQDDHGSLWDSTLSGRKTERVTTSKAPKTNELSVPVAGPSSATPKPFPARPPTSKRRPLTTLMSATFFSTFVFMLLLAKLGPSVLTFDLSSLIANSFAPSGPLDAAPQVVTTPPPPPPSWLGADLQVVRDALSVFSTVEEPDVKTNPPTEALKSVAEATSTEYRWFRSEYRWSRDDANKPITDVSIVPSSSVVIVGQQIAASMNDSYDTMGSAFHESVQLLSQYLEWSLENLAAFVAFAIDSAREQLDRDIRDLQALAEAIYEGLVIGASTSRQFIESSIESASKMSARLTKEGFLSPTFARDATARGLTQAQNFGLDKITTARKGLDKLTRIMWRVSDKAASEAKSKFVSTADCLHDRDGKKTCHRKSSRGGWMGKTGKKDKHYGRKSKHAKCGLTERLTGGCRGASAKRG